MTKQHLAKLMFAVAVFAFPTMAQSQTQAHIDNARSFSFGKISFSMTLEQFRKAYPFAMKGNATDEKLKFHHFYIRDPSKIASYINVWFYNGKMLELGIAYNKDLDRALVKIGGAMVLLRRLEQRFGKFNPLNFSDNKAKNETRIWWTIPQAKRYITIIERQLEAAVHVVDTELQRQLENRKATVINVGF